MIFTQFGLHRTGTNITRKILEDNYNAKVYPNAFGWKHHYPKKLIATGKKGIYPEDWKYRDDLARKETNAIDNLDDVKILVHFRNPYSWIYGIEKWKSIKEIDVVSHIKLYNEKNREFLKILEVFDDSTAIIHHDLIANPKKVMKKLENKYGLKGKREIIDDYVNASNERKDWKIDRDFYINKAYMDKIPVDLIKKHIDREVLNKIMIKYRYGTF